MRSQEDATPKTIALTGAAGMLGRAVAAAKPGHVTVIPLMRSDCDLANREDVDSTFESIPDLSGVIHCAGWTKVDEAESRKAEARRDNIDATRNVAEHCAEVGIPLVVVGTDYVFDGSKPGPYLELDVPSPRSVYGQTKLEAELAALSTHPRGTRIVRTSWLYGAGGRSFPETIVVLGSKSDSLRVVNDQFGAPTWTESLAPELWRILGCAPPGIYHATCSGRCSWYEFAQACFALAGLDPNRIRPCSTADYPRPAARPANSALSCAKLELLRGSPMPHWRDALEEYWLRRAAVPGG